MSGWKRVLAWVSAITGGPILVGSGGWLAVSGLDRPDRLASVVGVFATVVGLGVSAYAMVPTRRRLSRPAAGPSIVSAQGVVIMVTCVAVAGLGGLFAAMRWNQIDQTATVVSALAAVAALGVAVWAALPGSAARVRVSGTGAARSGPGGTANTGLTGPARELRGHIEVERTGPADATNGGNANTGITLT